MGRLPSTAHIIAEAISTEHVQPMKKAGLRRPGLG